MEINNPGHIYELQHLDGDGVEVLHFVDRGHGCDAPGTNNQEVLRALIDRVGFLNKECLWQGNHRILYHLRMALTLHETRHLERLVKSGDLCPEIVSVGHNGHFKLSESKDEQS